MATNVYVDAFNLYYGCLKGTPYRWLDLGALCTRLLPRDRINRIRYFTAMVSARPDDLAQVVKTKEKGSDVNLATFLLLDGFKRDCAVAVVISNDSDLELPIELAQTELGLCVGVVNPHPPGHRSRALQPNFFKQIRPAALAACQFPPVLSDATGEIHKPKRW